MMGPHQEPSMYVLPTAPLSVGGVLDDAIKLYRASFRSCWIVSLLGSLANVAITIWVFSQGLAGLAVMASKPGTDPALVMRSAYQTFSLTSKFYVLFGLIALVMFAMLFAQVSSVHRGRGPLGLGEAFALALRRLPGLIVGAVVFTFATGIGAALLLIPGIYLWGKLEFWFTAVFADDVGGVEGLGRSWNMTVGNWWRSVTILSMFLIIIAVLVYALAAALVLIASPLLWSHLQNRALETIMVSQIVRGLLSVVLLPVYPAISLVTYHDMKLRREGGDLAARANALHSA
jgi:hypothetical protein